MRLSKSQIKQFSSFFSQNIKDIKNFIEQNRDDYEQWLKEQESQKAFIIGSFVTGIVIRKIKKLEYINCNMRGGEKYGTNTQ